MKIRNGFVSNSSSSSFVLSSNLDSLNEIKVNITMSLSEAASDCKMLKNMNDVIVWMKENYSWELNKNDIDEFLNTHDQDDDIVQFYARCITLFLSGKNIIVGEVSSESDNRIESYLLRKGFENMSKDFEVLQDTSY